MRPTSDADGRCCYVYRAIDGTGALVDVPFGERRDRAAGKTFFRSAQAVTGIVSDRVTADGHDSYPRAIRTEVGKYVRHRISRYRNKGLEQDHRGLKKPLLPFAGIPATSRQEPWPASPMRGFGSVRSAARFCRGHDELRNLLRPRFCDNGHVPAARRRLLLLRRTATVLGILEAA